MPLRVKGRERVKWGCGDSLLRPFIFAHSPDSTPLSFLSAPRVEIEKRLKFTKKLRSRRKISATQRYNCAIRAKTVP